MYKRIVSAIVVAVLLITALASIKTQSQKTDLESLNTEDYLEDFDYMCDMIESEFIFLPLLEKQGIDYESVKQTTRNAIDNPDMDIQTFYNCISNMMSSGMRNKAHMGVITPERYFYFVGFGEENFSDGYNAVLRTSKTEKAYSYLADCASTTEQSGGSQVYEVTGKYDEDYHMVIFRIPTFMNNRLQFDENTIMDYLESLPETAIVENIVFDITGNTGGNNDCWLFNVVAPFGGDYVWRMEMYFRDSDTIRQQLIGEYNVGRLDETGNLPPDSIKGLGIDSVTEWSYPICSSPEKFSSARRWVLVDEGVFSAADAFTSYCKDTGWATVVGRKTSGDGSGQRIMVTLPNTGLIVEFSVMTTLNSKGEPNVLCGTWPDLPTKPSESPLQTLYRYIDKSDGEECVTLDSAYFTNNSEELNERYAKYMEKEHEDCLSGIEEIKDADVSIIMDGENVKSVFADVIFNESVSESEQEEIKDEIIRYLKSNYEDADITVGII